MSLFAKRKRGRVDLSTWQLEIDASDMEPALAHAANQVLRQALDDMPPYLTIPGEPSARSNVPIELSLPFGRDDESDPWYVFSLWELLEEFVEQYRPGSNKDIRFSDESRTDIRNVAAALRRMAARMDKLAISGTKDKREIYS